MKKEEDKKKGTSAALSYYTTHVLWIGFTFLHKSSLPHSQTACRTQQSYGMGSQQNSRAGS